MATCTAKALSSETFGKMSYYDCKAISEIRVFPTKRNVSFHFSNFCFMLSAESTRIKFILTSLTCRCVINK